MSIADMDEILLAQAVIPLSNVQANRRVVAGYQTGLCPGHQCHIGLRFHNKPHTGIDGTTFPAALWEQSPNFTLRGRSIRLAGIGAFNSKRDVPRNRWTGNENDELDRSAWRAALQGKKDVRARWFVLHDTGNGSVPRSAGAIGYNESGVHLFLDQSSLFLHHDFNETHTAVKFEEHHSEFRGQFIHVEHAYPPVPPERNNEANPPAPPRGYNYAALALAYLFASYRAREWLTVTCHLEVDRGFPNGHHDPRGFIYATFYRTILAVLGGSFMNYRPIPIFPAVRIPNLAAPLPGSTFGILDPRILDGRNMANFVNTFPAQYGPVQTSNTFTHTSGGRRARRP